MMPATRAPAATASTAAGRRSEAALCRSGSPEPPLLGVALGTTATHDVDVSVVTPPLGSVVVSVCRTGLDVVISPSVTVCCVDVGASDVALWSAAASQHVVPCAAVTLRSQQSTPPVRAPVGRRRRSQQSSQPPPVRARVRRRRRVGERHHCLLDFGPSPMSRPKTQTGTISDIPLVCRARVNVGLD